MALSARPRRTVLVVDDEPSVVRALSLGLPRFGYDAIGAADLAGAMTVLEFNHVDAAIVDIHLIGQSGLDVLVYVRNLPDRTPADLPILMFTGMSELSEDEEDVIRRHEAYVHYKLGGLAPLVATLDKLFPGPALAAA